jgi:hypothetical protein
MTVLLIDHQGARFFETIGGAGGLAERGRLEPKDTRGYLRHLEHRKEADYRGQRVPEADEFYDRIAERLRGSPSIVLVGDATGKSSAVRYLLGYQTEALGDRRSGRGRRARRLIGDYPWRGRGDRSTSLVIRPFTR